MDLSMLAAGQTYVAPAVYGVACAALSRRVEIPSTWFDPDYDWDGVPEDQLTPAENYFNHPDEEFWAHVISMEDDSYDYPIMPEDEQDLGSKQSPVANCEFIKDLVLFAPTP